MWCKPSRPALEEHVRCHRNGYDDTMGVAWHRELKFLSKVSVSEVKPMAGNAPLIFQVVSPSCMDRRVKVFSQGLLRDSVGFRRKKALPVLLHKSLARRHQQQIWKASTVLGSIKAYYGSLGFSTVNYLLTLRLIDVPANCVSFPKTTPQLHGFKIHRTSLGYLTFMQRMPTKPYGFNDILSRATTLHIKLVTKI